MTKPPTEREDLENGGHRYEDGLYDKDFLITEYEQAGEEYRYRDRLLHNSYYLLIIAGLAILTSIPNPSQEPIVFGMTMAIGGGVFLLLSMIIWKHVNERQSAGSLRTRAERYAEGIQFNPVKRPLGIQFWVIGNNTRIDDGKMEKRSFIDELRSIRTELFSAKTISLFVFILGIVQLGVGLCVLWK